MPDWQWVIMIHWDDDHSSPWVGPFGDTESQLKMREIRRRYREAGLKPPKIVRELLRVPGSVDSWVGFNIERRLHPPVAETEDA